MKSESLIALILWFFGLALLFLSSVLKCAWPRIWRRQLESRSEEAFSLELDEAARKRFKAGVRAFEIFLGSSLLLAGASGFYLFWSFWERSWAPIASLLVTGGMAMAMPALGERWCASNPPLEKLADFFITIASPGVALYSAVGRLLGVDIWALEAPWELEGLLGDEEREIIEGILDLEDTIAREIMVPRIDLVVIEAETPISQALRTVIESGHSRIPVYRDSIDNVVGILYAKDLLKSVAEGSTEEKVSTIVRPPYFVPETKNASELLREMQQNKVHMAIVVDEYGGTAGIVTIEDILEEIVGEIQDEYDVEEPMLQQVGEGDYIVDARLSLDDLEEILGFEVDIEGVDTVGGLVYSYLGRVPERGARVALEDFELQVLTVIGRRIGKVRVTRVKEKKSE